MLRIAALKPDLCVTAAYGNILPQRFLDIPRFGTLNIHPSLLPQFRGAAPVQRALQARPITVIGEIEIDRLGMQFCSSCNFTCHTTVPSLLMSVLPDGTGRSGGNGCECGIHSKSHGRGPYLGTGAHGYRPPRASARATGRSFPQGNEVRKLLHFTTHLVAQTRSLHYWGSLGRYASVLSSARSFRKFKSC